MLRGFFPFAILAPWELMLIVALIVFAFWLASINAGQESLQASRRMSDEIVLWVAQGMGLGRIPVAPGTFGSLGGILWFWLLLLPGDWFWFFFGTAAAVIASVQITGRAEAILKQKDPGSIVLDEIAAIPICFAAPVLVYRFKQGEMPSIEYFLGAPGIWTLLAGFVLFRFFDVAKPWPIRKSQSLPDGWGVTADDVLAGVATSAVLGLILFWSPT